jgi:DsbC/DsbD-like thiol-disulfide interchange protein
MRRSQILLQNNASLSSWLSSEMSYMNKKLVFTFFAFLTFVFAASASQASAQTVSGSLGNGTVAKGGKARGTITLSIPGHLHVNSSRPNSEYLIATSIRLSGGKGARVSGVTYPRGVNRKFQFSETPLNVYEGTVRCPFTVTIPANFKGNTISVRAVVRYQACTDEVCYPPKSREITLTARVR